MLIYSCTHRYIKHVLIDVNEKYAHWLISFLSECLLCNQKIVTKNSYLHEQKTNRYIFFDLIFFESLFVRDIFEII